MGELTLTVRIDGQSAGHGRTQDVVISDPVVVRFILDQPDPAGALSQAIRGGVSMLQFIDDPYEQAGPSSYRAAGAAW